MRVVLIGLGGIGSHLVEPLTRTLVYSKDERVLKRLILIDGDSYEERNKERQRYLSSGNKAEATLEWLNNLFPDFNIDAKPQFVDPENIFLFIKEGDVVFLAVDNHATRKIVSDYFGKLKDALLISGGNDEYDGNVQIYERRNGKNLTHPLTYLHPEIENPKDKNPVDIGCADAVVFGTTQILSVNLTIASLMLNAYALYLKFGRAPYEEIYFDLKTGNVRPVNLS